ncbi:hypothetical protein, partial [Pseudomonas viridiflava]|uniref:hypothetical protein n=1 Tax=Pseudomonas viridiflava TaxID=33069 RepID=UPI00197FDFF7
RVHRTLVLQKARKGPVVCSGCSYDLLAKLLITDMTQPITIPPVTQTTKSENRPIDLGSSKKTNGVRRPIAKPAANGQTLRFF